MWPVKKLPIGKSWDIGLKKKEIGPEKKKTSPAHAPPAAALFRHNASSNKHPCVLHNAVALNFSGLRCYLFFFLYDCTTHSEVVVAVVAGFSRTGDGHTVATVITGRAPPPARAESHHSEGSRELARPGPIIPVRKPVGWDDPAADRGHGSQVAVVIGIPEAPLSHSLNQIRRSS